MLNTEFRFRMHRRHSLFSFPSDRNKHKSVQLFFKTVKNRILGTLIFFVRYIISNGQLLRPAVSPQSYHHHTA